MRGSGGACHPTPASDCGTGFLVHLALQARSSHTQDGRRPRIPGDPRCERCRDCGCRLGCGQVSGTLLGSITHVHVHVFLLKGLVLSCVTANRSHGDLSLLLGAALRVKALRRVTCWGVIHGQSQPGTQVC